MDIAIDPHPAQIQAAAKKFPPGNAVIMLNLLKFRASARYQDQTLACSGEQAYARYSARALAFVESVGGKLIWAGSAQASVIAPAGEDWDKVLLVKYPDFSKFLEMVMNPDYQAITFHRSAALQNARLVACTEDFAR